MLLLSTMSVSNNIKEVSIISLINWIHSKKNRANRSSIVISLSKWLWAYLINFLKKRDSIILRRVQLIFRHVVRYKAKSNLQVSSNQLNMHQILFRKQLILINYSIKIDLYRIQCQLLNSFVNWTRKIITISSRCSHNKIKVEMNRSSSNDSQCSCDSRGLWRTILILFQRLVQCQLLMMLGAKLIN